MIMKIGVFSGAIGLPLLIAGQAFAQLPNGDLMCRSDEPTMDKYAYMRAVSLDLRGDVPLPEEYARVETESDLFDAVIDEWLGGEEFVERAVRYHRDLLWNNINNVRIVNYRANMTRSRMPNGELVYWRNRQAQIYRGLDRPPCRFEPATFDSEGNIEVTIDADGNRLEGYVQMEPYWAPGTTINVCAFDAQENAVSPGGTNCNNNSGYNDVGCGCGPNLQWCMYGYGSALQQAFAKDVELRIAALIREERPYTELFTSRRAYVNGPMVHYYKHLTGFTQGIRMEPLSVDVDRLPDIPFSDYYFHEIDLPVDHAGILTSPAFLLRFQTNRARANRFYESFLCSSLSPPPGGLPTADAGQRIEPDLQKRDGCKYCHAPLEPAAAHWGRWTESGAGFLSPTQFPAVRQDCEQCARTGQACSTECRLYYVTQSFSPEEDAFLGSLNGYFFRRPEHQRNVEMGPKLFVLSSIVDDRFPKCVATNVAQDMLGRQISHDEAPWIEELANGFLASGYKYRDLVKAILQSETYRRVQ